MIEHPPDLVITIDDVRKYHCVRGQKKWFEDHNLDFRKFLENGILATELLAAGDALAEHVVAMKVQNG